MRPRVFIKAPSWSESGQFMPVSRAVKALPPRFAHGGDGDDGEADEPALPVVQQSDLGAQAGEGKEEREEEDGTEIFDADAELVAEAADVRHDGAGEEGAEESVNADDLGAEGRTYGHANDGGERAFGRFVVREPFRADAAKESGFHHPDHEGDEGRDEQEIQGAAAEAGRPNDGHDEGEDAPGGDVADGGTSDGRGAEDGAGEAAFLEDAGQHWEGGDAHGDAHEESEGGERGAGRGEMAVKEPGQSHAEKIGKHDARMADDHRGVSLAADEAPRSVPCRRQT